MKELKKEESFNPKEDRLVQDYSVDHKGKVPLRASTGVWKASLFIISKYYDTRYESHVCFVL